MKDARKTKHTRNVFWVAIAQLACVAGVERGRERIVKDGKIDTDYKKLFKPFNRDVARSH